MKKAFTGDLSVDAFKMGSDDCTIYLGEELIYPIIHDYSNDYFTFEALEDGTFRCTQAKQYSLDNGETWITLNANVNTPVVEAGSKILWKNVSRTSGQFFSTGKFNAEGNVMSLLFGDDFRGQTSLAGYTEALFTLFWQCNGLISAENLVLPATTLGSGCYRSTFNEAHNLIKAPKVLPAPILTSNCYRRMFFSCRFSVAPEILATTMGDGSCLEMFNSTSKITYVKCLATNLSVSNCTDRWLGAAGSKGTFVKAASMTGWTRGVSGIPAGWTVVDA